MEPETKHRTELDFAGFVQRPRYTYYTCSVTLVQQPFMDYEDWTRRVAEFKAAHPDVKKGDKKPC